MRVAVVGAGGVGGYFGGRLARAGVDVTFLSRGAHLEALRARGLEVQSVLGDFAVAVRATDDHASVGPVDYVVVAVKAYDLDAVLGMLPDRWGGGSAVVSLQNGVCSEERIAAVVGPDRVIGGAAYIFAALGEPGVIEHTGGPARLVLGAWPQGFSQHVTELVSAFRESGAAADQSEDIRAVLWSKFAFICAQAGTTAAVRLPVGVVRSHAASRQLFRDLLTEVCAVAAAEHVTLPPDFVDANADACGRPRPEQLLLLAPRPRSGTSHGARGAARRRGQTGRGPERRRTGNQGRLRSPAAMGRTEPALRTLTMTAMRHR